MKKIKKFNDPFFRCQLLSSVLFFTMEMLKIEPPKPKKKDDHFYFKERKVVV